MQTLSHNQNGEGGAWSADGLDLPAIMAADPLNATIVLCEGRAVFATEAAIRLFLYPDVPTFLTDRNLGRLFPGNVAHAFGLHNDCGGVQGEFWARALDQRNLAPGRLSASTRHGARLCLRAVWGPTHFQGRDAIWVSFQDQSLEDGLALRLAKAKKALSKAEHASQRFLESADNDLLTPLNVILGLVDACDIHDDGAELRRTLDLIRTEALALIAQIDTILDATQFSQDAAAEKSMESIVETTIDPQAELRQLTRALAARAQGCDISIRLEISPGAPNAIRTDPRRLRQALLLMLEPGLRQPPGSRLTLSVTSVDAFAQFDVRLSAPQPACARSALRGHVLDKVTSTLRAKRHELPSGLERLMVPISGAGYREEKMGPVILRFLVVDDSEGSRHATTRLLAALGAHIDEAGSGAQALQKLSETQYDLVLMDLHMPHMDGFQATAKIRHSGEAFAKIPIIALSSDTSHGIEERVLQAGMDAFIAKPLNPADLARAIQSWADQIGLARSAA